MKNTLTPTVVNINKYGEVFTPSEYTVTRASCPELYELLLGRSSVNPVQPSQATVKPEFKTQHDAYLEVLTEHFVREYKRTHGLETA